jgi:CRP-like cAMP-binding protein
MDIKLYKNEIEFVFGLPIFKGLTENEKNILINFSYIRRVEVGDIIVREGFRENAMCFLIDGRAEIFKKDQVTNNQHKIAFLEKGSCIGEMEFIENAPRSATAIVVEPSRLFVVDLNSFVEPTEYQDIKNKIISNLSSTIVHRLEKTDFFVVNQLENRLKLAKFQMDNGQLMLAFLVITSIYGLLLTILVGLKQYLTSTTPISTVVLSTYFITLIVIVYRSGRQLDFFGLRFLHPIKTIFWAIVYSIPLLILPVIIKYYLIKSVREFNHLPLFNPFAGQAANISTKAFMLTVAVYILFCIVQEFIVRGCLQSTVKSFLLGSEFRRRWLAIISANAIFSVIHAHLTFGFSLLMFLVGIFFGWLFDKQKNLLGVSISHIILGTWALFVVGIQSVI